MKRSSDGNKETEKESKRARIEAPTSSATASHEGSSLQVSPISRFRGDLPFFRQPAELGHFSLDNERTFHDDNRQLRRFRPPHTIDFDLSVGYKDFMARDEEKKERLDHLLMWIQAHKGKFEVAHREPQQREAEENGHAEIQKPLASSSDDHETLHTDFVTWRGHLTKILCTPYESREPWQLAATLFNGTIYISEVETDEAKKRRQDMDAKHREMCYWGIKFEDYVTVPAFGGAPGAGTSSSSSADNSRPINNSEGYITVVRTRLNRHSLVFGAEVDCCTEVKAKPPDSYIELKTSHHPHNPHQRWSMMRYKLIKWWAQSYLAGVPKIICGMRDHFGHVDKLQTYNTLEIPRIVRGENDMWESNVCLNFLDKFLDWVKLVVKDDNRNKVYMIEWRDPFTCVTVREEASSESFLPEWFTGSS